jgi:3-hydroxyisobutyrate dehydrogenase
MVGGDRAVYERCKPALDAIGDKVTYTGGIGCGSICKLMHNCIVYGIQTIAAECYTLGVKAGVDPAPLAETIANGTAGRGVLFSFSFPETYFQGKFDPPQFALGLAHKDVGLAVALGREYNVPMALGNLVFQELTAAMNRGWKGRDSRVAMLLQEERAGDVQVRVRRPEDG